MTDPLRSETDDGVRVITLTRADEYNTINPASARRAGRRARRRRSRPRRARGVAAGRGPGVLRRLPARLGDAWPGGEPTASSRRVGLRGRPADDRPVRGDVGEAAHDLEADDRGGAGLVHRGRHQHGAQRRPDRVQPSRRGSATRRCACGGSPRRRGCGSRGLGLERAKRYLFTGDEISGEEAARLGLVLECVADDAARRARARPRASHRAAPARAAADDQVGAQRHRPADVRAGLRRGCSAVSVDGVDPTQHATCRGRHRPRAARHGLRTLRGSARSRARARRGRDRRYTASR